ncbi:capsule biosynthesis protein [Helicobacter mesocricetorum]|uniref:capsule biosynthesis protein n=1 Tax=Helicobacter mesocricetorum TaxID=87012 RepID=UPI000CF036EF|nr:capsule biosynthesis protein [Helicobacter mesocricetorum]
MGKLERLFQKQPTFQKTLPFLKSFKIIYVLMIPVIIYYLFIASDRYVSSMILSVRSISGDIAPALGLASLVGVHTGAREDILFLQQYIHSVDMLKLLDKEINLHTLYQNQKLDFFYTLSQEDSIENFLKFYQNRTKIVLNQDTGLLEIQVEGFTPQDSQTIANAILKESERFINEISHKAAREQMIFAEKELSNAKERLQNSQNALLTFQSQYGVFDPLKQAEAKAKLTADIEGKLAQKESELFTIQSYLNDNAPQIILLKSEIEALKRQLNKEVSKIVSSKTSQRLNDLIAKFQDLSIEVKFAQDAYTTALKAIESARIESSRKIKQLIVIQGANEPQSPTYPKKLYNILTIFAILALLFGIIKLINMIIEEHRY